MRCLARRRLLLLAQVEHALHQQHHLVVAGFATDAFGQRINGCARRYPFIRCLSVALLHNPNLLFSQPVQLMHQRVDLPIRRVDLTLIQLAVSTAI